MCVGYHLFYSRYISINQGIYQLMKGGNTALILATFLGARDVVKILLEYGADRTVKNAKVQF